MEVQNTVPVSNTNVHQSIVNQTGSPVEQQPSVNLSNINPDVVSATTFPVESSKGKGKGCLRVFLIVFGIICVLTLILFLTANLWYVSLFKGIFPEESNSSLYIEPQKRNELNFSDTKDWAEIEINKGSLFVPLGEIVNRVDRANAEYSYDFASGDLVYVMPADYSSGSSNYKMREFCLINVDNFEDVRTFPEYIILSMILVGKTLLLNQGVWGTIPYYYENDKVFVCQMGNISSTGAESSINLVIIPTSGNLEVESTYTQVLIFSDIIDQGDIDKIVGSIEFD